MSAKTGDSAAELAKLLAGSAHLCVTSPPYFEQRDYGVAGQIGLEASWFTTTPWGETLMAEARALLARVKGDTP